MFILSLAEKLTEKIMELVRLETVTIFAGITGRDMVANCTELGQAIAETKRLVNEKLLHRLDFNDGWLDFLNLPEYNTVRESDGDLLFKAAASGYELGYLDGWQDRDGLINKPWKG